MDSNITGSDRNGKVAAREGESFGGQDDDGRQMRWREDWGAMPPIADLKPMGKPVHNVILTYTGTEPCEGTEQCDKSVLEIQDRYQQSSGLPDIPYSFLVSKDGLIYEGRGWDYRPFVPKKAFPKIRGTRIVIAQINKDFDNSLLPPADAAIWDLLQHGVDNKFIHPNAEKIQTAPWI